MGCFSYLCKVCGEPINSDSVNGEHVTLYLLEKGKIIEEMTGQYDSYGCVFDKDGENVEWKSYPWSNYDKPEFKGKTICTLICDFDDSSNGIAAIHTDCRNGLGLVPIECSEDDPEQGWGEFKHSRKGEFSHKVHKAVKR